MTPLPTITSYGQYSSQNYAAHTLCVTMGGMDVYFSYQTPVAFRGNGHPLTVRQNDWGPTTSKHLNWIDGGRKKERAEGPRFEAQLEHAMSSCKPSKIPA